MATENNHGRNPFDGAADEPYIDIRYRNNLIVRHVLPSQYRWKQWPAGPHDFDVVSWQLSTAKEYEIIWPESC